MKLLDRFSLREAETLTPEDEARLNRIPIPNADRWADCFRSAVACGAAMLSHVVFEGQTVGTVVWRIEQDVERELVIMSAASSRPGLSITAFLAQAIDSLAALQKCETARFHTVRPGLVRYAHSKGWQTSEIVLRKTYVP